MRLNMDYATDADPIVVDVETAGLPNAAEFLEPVEADKRLKDPDKIAADLAEKALARLDRLALDWNVGRIAALGWWTERGGTVAVAAPTEQEEQEAIAMFWGEADYPRRTLVGFNIKGFDLRFLVQRSRLLGLKYPRLDFSKYNRRGISDLYLDLTFGDGHYDNGCMRRTLHAFCRRFGIPVTDTTTGKDIPALVAAGDYDAVVAHLTLDIELTVALARKLGVVRQMAQQQTVF
jgi:hypothetical protein